MPGKDHDGMSGASQVPGQRHPDKPAASGDDDLSSHGELVSLVRILFSDDREKRGRLTTKTALLATSICSQDI
jgi:hypothetical protein